MNSVAQHRDIARRWLGGTLATALIAASMLMATPTTGQAATFNPPAFDLKRGSVNDYTYLFGNKARNFASFDTCTYKKKRGRITKVRKNRTIYYGGVGVAWRPQVREALNRVSAVTGHRFVLNQRKKNSRNYIRFVIKRATSPNVHGYAQSYKQGKVLFKARVNAWPASGEYTIGTTYDNHGNPIPWKVQADPVINVALFMHEVAHALGAGHAKQKTQLMYPQLQVANGKTFGAGDYTVLKKVGYKGCKFKKGQRGI